MMILGKDCTLTASKENDYVTLPVTQETIRIESKGFALPCVIGRRNREVNIQSGSAILGCFVSRLEYSNIYFLFSLVSSGDVFDLFISHVVSKLVYRNLGVKSFELRAECNEPFYFRIDVQDCDNSFVDSWGIGVPDFKWAAVPTYFFDGHNVVFDFVKQPLIYRFEILGDFTESRKFFVVLYFALSDRQNCCLTSIKSVQIPVCVNDGVFIELNDLVPVDNLIDVNCASEILIHQKFMINGDFSLVIRNENEFKVVVL